MRPSSHSVPAAEPAPEEEQTLAEFEPRRLTLGDPDHGYLQRLTLTSRGAAIAQAESETQQLRSVLAQVQKFEARKAQLQQRVTLIEQLRRGQSSPVHVVDELGKSVPERLWLTELAQKDAEFIQGLNLTLRQVCNAYGVPAPLLNVRTP